jgi:predicted anti-sigma-YlaC factor YlaD
MSSFDSSRLSVWLQRVVATKDHEIDCDELAVTIEVVVEAAARGEDVRASLPAIAVHLDQCPDCQEWFETLVDLTREAGRP